MLFFRRRNTVVIRPRAEHTISRQQIAPEALKVLYRLNEAGYKAYLVGGSVRDLLLGREPKDFDVGTDAQPREIRRLFRNCFLVGRRFRLAHVVFGDKVIETSTFRRQPDDTVEVADESTPGALYQSSDNTFGTPEEDARRRDFTVNGLFYDIKTFDIIDFVDGLRDLDQRLLRMIGDPNVRLREDPVRMMRAVRLAARLDMTIEKKTYRAICAHHAEIAQASPARVLEEIFRLFAFSTASKTFKLLWQTRLMAALMPKLDHYVKHSGKEQSPLWTLLDALDALERQADEPFSNGLHLAVLAYPIFQAAVAQSAGSAGRNANHLDLAEQCLADFNNRFKVPKAVLFHAVHLLDDQQRLDALPAPGRRIRPGRASEFADALRLARIRLAAGGGSVAVVDAWQRLMPEAPGQGPARHGRPGPHPDAPREETRATTLPADAGDTARPPDGAEAPAHPAGGTEEAAPGSAARKRRRRRGGRRHRHPSDEGGTSAAPAAPPPAGTE
jgi:poly(A) polymerase